MRILLIGAALFLLAACQTTTAGQGRAFYGVRFARMSIFTDDRLVTQ